VQTGSVVVAALRETYRGRAGLREAWLTWSQRGARVSERPRVAIGRRFEGRALPGCPPVGSCREYIYKLLVSQRSVPPISCRTRAAVAPQVSLPMLQSQLTAMGFVVDEATCLELVVTFGEEARDGSHELGCVGVRACNSCSFYFILNGGRLLRICAL
jgi:hypothetical protein